MSNFEPHKLEEVIPGQKDILHGGISMDALYSVKLQNATSEVQQTFNSYYICTPGMGLSIEIEGKFGLGKFTEDELNEKLEGRIFLQSSIGGMMEFSKALKAKCQYMWTIENFGTQYYLIAQKPNEKGKVIRIYNHDAVIRPLKYILDWEAREAYPFMSLSKESRDELAERLKKEWDDEQWPAPGESVTVEHAGEQVYITHEDHMEYININFFDEEARAEEEKGEE